MTPTPVLPSLPERTPTDYALALAEYMAIGAERLLDAINAEDVALERLGDPAERMTNEHVDEEAETARANRCELATGLRSDIYEFRKRRDRAIESLSSAPAEPVAEIFDTFGNSQDPTKCVGHVWLKVGYFPPRGTKLYAHPTESAGPAPAEIEADARRYRWLRRVDSYAEWNRVGHFAADALDAAVDAAIKLGESHE